MKMKMKMKMNIGFSILTLLLAASVASCKVVNTHAVKLTNAPVSNTGAHLQIKTTVGSVFLSYEKLSKNQREMLLGIRPFQCLAITTSESFNMRNREVYLTDFKLKKLLESDRECRKIDVNFNITIDR